MALRGEMVVRLSQDQHVDELLSRPVEISVLLGFVWVNGTRRGSHLNGRATVIPPQQR
jgi:hypothetical protein